MRSKRSFYILVGVTVVAVAAAVLSQRSSNEPPPSYGLQVPGLGSKIKDVHAVVIRKAKDSLRLERTKNGWIAESKDGYPADGGRIRHLVLGISQLQRLEKKTRDPNRYSKLKLSDIDKPGSRAVEVTFLTDDNEKLADLLVGKTEEFETTTGSKYFVRNAGDPQSWLVEGTLPPVVADMGDWLQRALLPGVGKSGIESVSVTQPGSEPVSVRRESRDKTNFRLVGLKGDEKISNQYSLNAIPETFQGLSLKDVDKVGALKDKTVALTLEARTFNGVDIVARFGHLNPDYSVRLQASYDPEQDQTAHNNTPQSAGQDKQGGTVGKDQGHGSGQAQQPWKENGQNGANTKDQNKKEPNIVPGDELAKSLNERWQGRYFVVSKYSLDPLMVRRSDLVKEPKKSSKSG